MITPYIIAEAGVNHNGDPDIAFKLVDAAISAGVDAVKFQTFKADKLVTADAPKADYQINKTNKEESHLEMLKKLELSKEVTKELMSYCKSKKIDFLSTAFDSESLNFLADDLCLNTLKISSGDITNGPFLLEHSLKNVNLIISTGMATFEEITDALGVVAFGLMNRSSKSASKSAFKDAFSSNIGKDLLRQKVTLLHCTSEYPAPFSDINLNAMKTMRERLGIKTGYSDHSQGNIVPIIAASLGASIIEKHFTIDRNLPGPDHKTSLNPNELKEMVEVIKTAVKVMGDGIKSPKKSEMKNQVIARKSLIAATKINKGDLFTELNLIIKRPGTGISPMEYWDILNSKSSQDYNTGQVIL
jgi:N-acetylneuraminate synthase